MRIGISALAINARAKATRMEVGVMHDRFVMMMDVILGGEDEERTSQARSSAVAFGGGFLYGVHAARPSSTERRVQE